LRRLTVRDAGTLIRLESIRFPWQGEVMTAARKTNWKRWATFGAALAVLGVMGLIIIRDSRAMMTRRDDLPPVVDFTWTPVEPADLREVRGFLSMKDDYGLDFKTYRMRIVEMDKEWGLPIDGLMGKDYEQPISLGLIDDRPEIADSRQVTIEFSIADDRGHATSITRVIRLRQP